ERSWRRLGWSWYLPEEWCDDPVRRRKAKIAAPIWFQTKPDLAADLCQQAAGWEVPVAPILADAAYGDDTGFRSKLHQSGLEYLLAVRAQTSVSGPDTIFAVPERTATTGRPRTVARPDQEPESGRCLAERLPAQAWQTLPCRTTPTGTDLNGRFAFIRVCAAHPVTRDHQPPRFEWLIIEWPEGADAPTDYWLSNLAEDTP